MAGQQPQARLDRINALAKKAKTTGLSEDEKKERELLRKAYLKDFREGLKQRLETTKYYDNKGREITPEKIKDVQRKQGWRED